MNTRSLSAWECFTADSAEGLRVYMYIHIQLSFVVCLQFIHSGLLPHIHSALRILHAHCATPCRTILHHTTLCHTMPNNTTPHHTTPCHTILHCITPYHTMPNNTTPHHTTLYYTMLYCTIMHCIFILLSRVGLNLFANVVLCKSVPGVETR